MNRVLWGQGKNEEHLDLTKRKVAVRRMGSLIWVLRNCKRFSGREREDKHCRKVPILQRHQGLGRSGSWLGVVGRA